MHYGTVMLSGADGGALQGGDLSQAISNDRTGHLRWSGRGQNIALDVVRGLAYLHACKVGHPAASLLEHLSAPMLLAGFCVISRRVC